MRHFFLVLAMATLLACPEGNTLDAGEGFADAAMVDSSSGVDGGARDRGVADSASGDRASADQSRLDAFVFTCPGDDVYEPNDSAGEAFALANPGPVADTLMCDEEDWFAITVPAGFGLGVRLELSAASPDLDLELYDAVDPATMIDRSATQNRLETVFGELYGQATPVLLRVLNNDSADTGTYRLVISFYLDGVCASDGVAEPNDSPAEATELTAPLVRDDLHACDQHDWYRLTVPANNGVLVELDHRPTEAELSLELALASDPNTPLAESHAFSPHKELSQEIFADATDLLVHVTNLSYPGPRGDYSLDISLYPGGYCVDDGHEPDDDLAQATDLDTGLLGGVLWRDNVDVFTFSIAHPGAFSRVEVAHAGFALDASLTIEGGAAPPDLSVSDDGQVMTLTFTSAATTRYVLRLAKASGETVVAGRYNIQGLYGTPPANDRCASAVSLSPGGPVTGSTVNGYDDVAFISGFASCTGSDSDGPDVFYAVQVPAGQTLSVSLTSHDDFQLYLIDTCDTRCCFAGVDDKGADLLNDVVETLVWTNTGASAADLFVGVDSRGMTLSGEFSIEMGLGAGATSDAGAPSCRVDRVADGGVTDAVTSGG